MYMYKWVNITMIQALPEEDVKIRDLLQRQCQEVLDNKPSSLPALSAIAYLTLLDIIKGIYMYICTCTCMTQVVCLSVCPSIHLSACLFLSPYVYVPLCTITVWAGFPDQPGSVWMTDWTQSALQRLYAQEEEGEGEEEGKEERGEEKKRGEGLGCVGMACVQVAQALWRDARTLLEKGIYMYVQCIYSVCYTSRMQALLASRVGLPDIHSQCQYDGLMQFQLKNRITVSARSEVVAKNCFIVQ